MTDETKQEYMLRISQANSSRLVVIVYDMFLNYTREAQYADRYSDEYKTSLSCARSCLSELINSLHMDQELAGNFYQLYRFVERQLVTAQVRRDPESLEEAISIMQRLRDAYAEACKDDNSEPLMKNTDVVYAGMTYGRSDVNTASYAAGTNRGYLA